MERYQYGRIRVLAGKLAEAGVEQAKIDRIMAGGECIRGNSSPEKKATWLSEAMNRMDSLLDAGTCRAIRESCACCLGGKRLEVSRSIQNKYATFEERLAACNEAKFVFGHSVTTEDDGRVRVSFAPEGLESYRCVCLPKAKEPVSVTYCYCCGGHVKHHLQIALGRQAKCEVASSALASGGKLRCSFLFTLEE